MKVKFAGARLPCLLEIWISFGKRFEVDRAVRWSLGEIHDVYMRITIT